MIATGSTLGCGMSLMVAVFSADLEAGLRPAQSYRFGEHVVVVQPGPVAATLGVATVAAPVAPLPSPQAPPSEWSKDGVVVSPGAPAASAEGADLARRYRELYSAIPFDRAEYEANPSYRHDATLELLFGQQRPTTIHRGHTTIEVRSPGMPYAPPTIHPFGVDVWNAPYTPFWRPGYRVHRSF
jgi:hypothetical protein